MDNKNDSTIDTFIVDFYSSYPSKIKVNRGLGWGFFDILDTIEISTKNFTASLALDHFDGVDNLDVIIYRNVDCATISHHIRFFDSDSYFNALIEIYNKCITNRINKINERSKCCQFV